MTDHVEPAGEVQDPAEPKDVNNQVPVEPQPVEQSTQEVQRQNADDEPNQGDYSDQE